MVTHAAPVTDQDEAPELRLGEQFHAKHAHKYVAAYVCMLLLLGVLGAVYGWQHKKVTRLNAQVQTLQNQVSSSRQKLAALHSSAQAAPVKPISTDGWKTYCDPKHSECFNYPANWTLTTDQAALNSFGYVTVTLTNPARTLQVNYANTYVKDGLTAAFHTNVLSDPAASGTGLRIVGGYVLAAIHQQPVFAAADASAAASLKAGSIGQLTTPVHFTDKSSKQIAVFYGGPSSNNLSAAQADAWFATADAQTIQAILRSVHY